MRRTAEWRKIPCPVCGAKIGKRCWTHELLAGIRAPATNPHAARVMATDKFRAELARNLAGDIDMTHIPFRKVGAG